MKFSALTLFSYGFFKAGPFSLILWLKMKSISLCLFRFLCSSCSQLALFPEKMSAFRGQLLLAIFLFALSETLLLSLMESPMFYRPLLDMALLGVFSISRIWLSRSSQSFLRALSLEFRLQDSVQVGMKGLSMKRLLFMESFFSGRNVPCNTLIPYLRDSEQVSVSIEEFHFSVLAKCYKLSNKLSNYIDEFLYISQFLYQNYSSFNQQSIFSMSLKTILFVSLLFTIAFTRSYPLYKQCDSQWGNDQLGTSSKTICQAGCLMSSAAMALSGTGHSYNPKTLNAWLKANGGYVSGDLFVWGSIGKLGLTYKGKVANSAIKSNLDAGNVVICNVHNGGHWVLAHGYSGDNILVNDPGYSTTSYTLSQIVNNQNGVYGVSKMPQNFNTLYYEIKETIYDYLNIKEFEDIAEEPEVERNLVIQE